MPMHGGGALCVNVSRERRRPCRYYARRSRLAEMPREWNPPSRHITDGGSSIRVVPEMYFSILVKRQQAKFHMAFSAIACGSIQGHAPQQ
jgi:hypothetical protein